ncbi:tRNA (5-methylaminomethyl-2-thiouridylate)-methyltransferase / FAD-dependent cmnm(5)s(2)U34 oxidoreductase [Caballeronia glathei]|nr:tRNA (5-methylaminomethyl-2-thiouridylate)-methyltransferase / FAD-dependent cmnm(5)s(2)U34 oxidoreductase [Caballeronia glathei]
MSITAPWAGPAQAQHVFLQGNGLPGRWQGQPRFTVLETGFGMGINFLATWAAWRSDPARCERLHFVSIEKHPLSAQDLRCAYAATVTDESLATLAAMLADAWPPLVPGAHQLPFDAGRVTLTLAFGDAADVLPTLSLRANAFFSTALRPRRTPTCGRPRSSVRSRVSPTTARRSPPTPAPET